MNLPESLTTDTKRAQNVCHACMLRKKACDKALPACSFCASRQLHCRYDTSIPRSRYRRAYNPGRQFVLLPSPSPPSVSPQTEAITQLLPPPESRKDTPFQSFNLYVPPQSVEESVNQLAQHFSESIKLTYDNIIDHYFQAFHKWLPAVSPNSFRREASEYQKEGRPPPADFTVLLLTMLLIILPALDFSLRPPRAIQDCLYASVKPVFSQAQISICASLRLTQAAFLIALREYTSVRPEAAYISMMTCVGLARVLEIGTKSSKITRNAQIMSGSQSEKAERKDLASAITMLERYE